MQISVFIFAIKSHGFYLQCLELAEHSVFVNRSKSTPDNLQEGFNIERVPTFIFYKEGKEIGRFVEFPQESVEADMLKIVSGEPYKHSYEN